MLNYYNFIDKVKDLLYSNLLVIEKPDQITNPQPNHLNREIGLPANNLMSFNKHWDRESSSNPWRVGVVDTTTN